jgi:uncharacterized protein YbjT (DUF2867 family)
VIEKKTIVVVGATGAQGGGLVRAILADTSGQFAVRAITRKPDSDKARALAAQGAEVVAGDADQPSTLANAFAGAYGAFCVTNFWEHGEPERELRQATALARATKQAGLKHVVWSTLEDTRKDIPLSDNRMPTLKGKYKVPHFVAKGEANAVFEAEGAPSSYMLAAFYWDNLIHFGMGPRKQDDGSLVFALPLGGQKLPGIGAEDIGGCAYGIFKRGPSVPGQSFGISGENLSGEEMAAKLGKALGQPVKFQDVPFDVYRGLGFPGADDLGNMFQYHMELGEKFMKARDPKVARELNPNTRDFDQWLRDNAAKMHIG